MNELKNLMNGRVLLPGDEGFDEARTPWNVAVDQRVRAVVDVADTDDVAAAIGYARLHGLAVTAQPSGHGASGDTEGAILLRTRGLGGVEIHDGVARVGAGVRWGEVLAAASPLGLTGLAGSSPVVSVAGYTLGGGLSWFSRAYGFAADTVRAFDAVDAEGRRIRVTAGGDPELFWALRGGGGDFAIVTAMEFELRPAPSLYGGRITWPIERAPAVLDAFREVTASAPEELTVWFDLLQIPGGPGFVMIDSTCLGRDPGGLLRPFERIGGAVGDTRRPLPVAELGSICDEPTDPSPGTSRCELLTGLDDQVAGVLLGEPIDPLTGVQIRHLGGALARPAAGGGAAGHLDEPYLVYAFGRPGEATAERLGRLGKELVPFTSGRKPYTMLHGDEQAAAAFPGETLARLRDLKRARDPHGVIRANYPVLG
ncbi:FAD-binding protein [Nonomuraea phyllanthi]|uniref:FAD-binding protein n=1 Tax=Nonomuraea phyllanthi TaxID=2219224 RepID=A0A5C4WCF6_9ACTN|nr:FAD-binding oxidoreductase [Nonomuraea phyllanthi]KAB8193003.1 FAD-binding protein [Nonomuraea phyllanthi]QFY11136.1 FAD-binding protein [Nonomuraea phyllanthi]